MPQNSTHLSKWNYFFSWKKHFRNHFIWNLNIFWSASKFSTVILNSGNGRFELLTLWRHKFTIQNHIWPWNRMRIVQNYNLSVPFVIFRLRILPEMTAKKHNFVSQFDLVSTLSLSCIMCPGLRPFEIWLWEWISRVHFSFTTKTRANWFISDGFHSWNINENTTRSTGNILIRDKNENAFFRSLLYCWGIRILINEFNSLCLLHNIDILVDTVTKN